MEKCGVHSDSTVDVHFDSFTLVHKECTAFTMLEVRASKISEPLASLDKVFSDLFVTQVVEERVRLKTCDRLGPSELWHAQEDSGLAEFDTVMINESAFEIEPRLIISRYLLPCVEYDTPWLVCANARGVYMAARLEERPKKVICDLIVLQHRLETLQDRSIRVLQVVDEQAEMLHICRFVVCIGFGFIRTYFELREEME